MSVNSNPPDLARRPGQAMSNAIANADDEQDQVRREVDLKAVNETKAAWERNLRERANMEMGRARNITKEV